MSLLKGEIFMFKTNSLSKKIFFIAIASIMLAILALSGLTLLGGSNKISSAANEPASDSISVSAVNRNNEAYYGERDAFNDLATYDNIAVTPYYWSLLSHFKISYKEGQTSINPINNKYHYKLEVQMVQKRAEIAGQFTSLATSYTPVKLYEGDVDSLTAINDLKYYIDKDVENPTLKSCDYGWGIYRFILTINNVQLPSELYYVAPSKIIEAPTVTWKPVSSSTSIQDAFEFTIINESYKYVDRNLIRWYVKGEANDGTKYALHKDDLGTADFPTSDYKNALYDALDRDGTTFHFDTNNISGTWQVYCVIYEEAPTFENLATNEELFSTESDAIQVVSGKKIKASNVIWFIVAGGAVLLGVIIFIIVKSVKKEKVW